MTSIQDNHNKIISLQALRAIAFLGIFLRHADAPHNWSALGVSVFYVMSGFLLFYKHGESEINYDVQNRILFSLNRIKKLYPLHILTMLLVVLLELFQLANAVLWQEQLGMLIRNIILNVFLLQTWVPDSTINVSLNGVAWYLSVALFLYFMFPAIHRYTKKEKMRNLWLISILLLIIQVIACIPFISFFGYDSRVYIWFMYCFPVFRLGDFFIGCVLGKSYLNNSKASNTAYVRDSVIELVIFIATVFAVKWIKLEPYSIVARSLHNWTTLNIPVAAIWVYLFAKNGGIITRILSNRILINLGNISSYTFLIHFVITRYTNFFLMRNGINVTDSTRIVLIIAEFIVTIGVTLYYQRIKDRWSVSNHNDNKGE